MNSRWDTATRVSREPSTLPDRGSRIECTTTWINPAIGHMKMPKTLNQPPDVLNWMMRHSATIAIATHLMAQFGIFDSSPTERNTADGSGDGRSFLPKASGEGQARNTT
jgi:hypothetical protein